MENLSLLTDPDKVAQAQQRFYEIIVSNANKIHKKLTYRQHSASEIYHVEKYGFWVAIQKLENRYWNAFGLWEESAPTPDFAHSIVCEINIPYEGINQRIAGAFASLGKHLIMLHRGRIGGGKKGIGKELFINKFEGKWLDINSNVYISKFAIVGEVGSLSFLFQLKAFIENINTIKTEHTESRLNTDIIDNGYKNEFAGEKLWLRESAIVITQCNHGYIVRELATLLKNRGYEVNNNQQLDLYLTLNKKITTIFEVKTDLNSQYIYTAVGQLMIHSKAFNHEIRKVIVLPTKLKSTEIETRLRDKLEIEILYYNIEDRVQFLNLDALVL